MYFPNIFVEHSYAGIRAVSILLGLCGSSTALADRYESFDDGMTPLNWSELASPVAAAGEFGFVADGAGFKYRVAYTSPGAGYSQTVASDLVTSTANLVSVDVTNWTTNDIVGCGALDPATSQGYSLTYRPEFSWLSLSRHDGFGTPTNLITVVPVILDPGYSYRFVCAFGLGTQRGDVYRLTPGAEPVLVQSVTSADTTYDLLVKSAEMRLVTETLADLARADFDNFFVSVTSGGDFDGDGITNINELTSTLTQPWQSDTDGDGLSDSDELGVHGTNPNVSDSDADGLTDGQEVNAFGTDPSDYDSDNDGLPDGSEVNLTGTDPNDEDSDDDGLSDKEEAGNSRVFVTSSAGRGDFGGLASADANCNALAASAGLSPMSGYRAWLSTESIDARERIVDASYYRVDGAKVAGSLADLTDGVLDNAISVEETGAQTLSGFVWTGTTIAGIEAGVDNTCDDWTNSVGVEGTLGNPQRSDSEWTNRTTGVSCAAAASTSYCFSSYYVTSNPNLGDSDFDGLSDGDEVNVYGTDPTNADSDGDGVNDGAEVSAGTDPDDSTSVPLKVNIPIGSIWVFVALGVLAWTARASRAKIF